MSTAQQVRPRLGSPRLPASFWERVTVGPTVFRGEGRRSRCWLWDPPLGSDGYPNAISIATVRQSPVRHAYRALVGDIPDGLTLDHLCRVRNCVNPSHCEPVTGGENARRAKLAVTHCPQDHRYTPGNIVWVRLPSGTMARGCRTCYNDRSRDYWHSTRKHAQKAERRAAGYRGGWDETDTCNNGHEKTPETTYVSPAGAKACKLCRAEAAARNRARKRGELSVVA